LSTSGWEATFFPLFLLFFFFYYSLSILTGKAKAQCSEWQKEICKRLGQPGPAIIHGDTETLTALKLPPFHLSEGATLLGEHNTLSALEGTT
jgi:hypothetical protein